MTWWVAIRAVFVGVVALAVLALIVFVVVAWRRP